MVSMAIVWVHSVGVRGRPLMCSSAKKQNKQAQQRAVYSCFALIRTGRWKYSRRVLHHPTPLNLHPLQHLVLMDPLHRSPQYGHMVRQGLVVSRKMLGQWGTWRGEVMGRQWRGRGRWHSMTRRVRWQWCMKGVGNDIFALLRRLRCELGVPVGMRTGGGGLMVQRTC